MDNNRQPRRIRFSTSIIVDDRENLKRKAGGAGGRGMHHAATAQASLGNIFLISRVFIVLFFRYS